MKRKLLSLLVIFSLVFNACNTGDDTYGNGSGDEQFAQNFGAAVARDFIGQIIDSDHHPVSGATVSIGSSVVQTDENGIFILNDAEVHEKFAYITAEKSGFIKGSRSLVPTSGKNNVLIMLIPSTPIGTIASGETGVLTLENGTKVTFDGAFETEDGSHYSGPVSVSVFHLETSDENISSLMPGMLYAKGEDNQAKVLQTFGMLNVELRGNSGQKLQIKSGHKAQISMRIDDTQLATAPQTIPLWHFDEAVGYWKQEGEAARQGNFYVGEVSHFSWWNCDTFSSTINLTVTVTDENGNPIPNIGTALTSQTAGASAVSYTDEHGQVSGFIPANQAIQVNIYSICGTLIASIPAGPFAADTILPSIVVQSSTLQMATVSGSLMACGNTPVSNGYVLLNYGVRTTFTAVTNGEFNIKTVICAAGDTFQLEGFDYGNLQTTTPIQFYFSTPVTDVGTLYACNTVDEFITYQIDSEPVQAYLSGFSQFYYANESSGFGGPQRFTIEALQQGMPTFQIGGGTHTPGTYNSNMVGAFGPVPANSLYYNTVIFHINKFGEPGDYVDITGQGKFIDLNTGQLRDVKISVHVKRD